MAETSASGAEPVYLVDGSGYIFRAFYGLPPMTNPEGVPVNAVFGFSKMLAKLMSDAGTRRFAVIFDTARVSFRNDIFPDYKANRSDPPEELVPQFALIREATRAFNVPCIELAGFEADDLIATFARMAREEGHEVVIVSSDKDLMQLVADGVSMLDPAKNVTVGREQVIERFGVGPESVIDVQALAGDSTDNVPGVPGIGVKTAAELIRTYGDLDTLLERADEIKQPKRRENLINHAGMARISRDLVTLRIDAPVEHAVDDLIAAPPDSAALRDFLLAHGFKSMLAQMEAQFGSAEGGDAQEAEAAPAEREYSLVTDAAALQRWIDEAVRAGTVAVDTETTSLDSMRAELVGVSLSVEPGRACYVPLAHVAPGGEAADLIDGAAEAPHQIPLDEALAALKKLLEDPGVLKIGHNIKYDMEVLARYGIDVAPVDDTMLLSYVLEAGIHGHGLDELSKLHFDHANIKFSDVAGSGRNAVTFAEVPLDAARGLRGRGRRHDAPAAPPAQAPAGRRPHGDGLRDPGAPAGRRAGRDGTRRDPGRRLGAGRALARFRAAGRRARRKDLAGGRARLQYRLAQTARLRAVRGDGAPGRQEDQGRAPGPPAPMSSKGSRARATRCPGWCSTGASSPSCAAPIPRRSPRRSTRRPGGCTPRSARRSPRPGG